MRITRSETHVVRVDFEGVMPGMHVVLRLGTGEGAEGISYVSRVNPQTAKPLRLLVDAMAEAVSGMDATDTDAIHAKLFSPRLGAPVTGLEQRAASAVEVAAWDLRGKAARQPLHRLMGGFRDRLPVSANWRLMPGPAPDAIAAHLEDLLGRGFRAVKCPVGFAPLESAAAHVAFVRQCVGPDVRIIVDGNFQWTREQALRFARETEELDLFWIEDPVAHHDYEGMRLVREAATQRICAGEVYQQPHEFRRLLDEQCCDYVMIDQDMGLTGFVAVARMAAQHGCPVVNHLAPEVLSHALAGVPNGLIVGLVPWGQPLFTEPMRVEDGELVMPEGPGLGLTLDEDVLKRCAVE